MVTAPSPISQADALAAAVSIGAIIVVLIILVIVLSEDDLD